jgi:two-component system sensor histidine kinase RegB
MPANDILPPAPPRPGGLGITADWQTVRLDTLLSVRWIAIGGQLAALLLVDRGFKLELPLAPALAIVAASAIFNIILLALYSRPRRLADREAALHLAFDVLQLSGLLYFTGGLENPFSLLIIVPVTISATNLAGRSTVMLVLLAMAAITVLWHVHQPLPGFVRLDMIAPLHLAGIWAALMLGIPFTALYAWRVAHEARKRAAALAATQLALAREQKLSALGGLAAAAAHELGTPLGTISVVAKELARGFKGNPELADDLQILQEQAVRCREILESLSQAPEMTHDGLFATAPFSALVDEALAPFEHMDPGVTITRLPPGGAGPAPRLPRQPEILHSLGNFIENAVDFARASVELRLDWTRDTITLIISDDGPGFPPDVLAQLGEPYVTRRVALGPVTERHHDGLGLGVFIAKTLLERTGAQLAFSNRPGGGARIVISWSRAKLDEDQ